MQKFTAILFINNYSAAVSADVSVVVSVAAVAAVSAVDAFC